MAKLVSLRALLSCDDDASAAAAVNRRLKALGPMLLDSRVDAVIDYDLPPSCAAGKALADQSAVPAGPDVVHLEVRKGHLQLATENRVVMDFGAGHFSAHLDDATHIARCLNAHHRLVSALRDAMHHLTLTEAAQKTPMTTAEIIEIVGGALKTARTPAVIETIPTASAHDALEAIAA
jgi:hypothetical protein